MSGRGRNVQGLGSKCGALADHCINGSGIWGDLGKGRRSGRGWGSRGGGGRVAGGGCKVTWAPFVFPALHLPSPVASFKRPLKAGVQSDEVMLEVGDAAGGRPPASPTHTIGQGTQRGLSESARLLWAANRQSRLSAS